MVLDNLQEKSQAEKRKNLRSTWSSHRCKLDRHSNDFRATRCRNSLRCNHHRLKHIFVPNLIVRWIRQKIVIHLSFEKRGESPVLHAFYFQ